MEKLEVHVRIHQLRQEGFSISAIARKCGVSRNTVYSYDKKDFDKTLEWVGNLKTRKRKLDPYQDHILFWLKEHPDLSSSQVTDWLEDRCSFKNIGESTVRTYVRESSYSYQEFLRELLTYEEKRREEKMIEKHLKLAKFPYQKSLDDFDLKELPTLSKRQLKQLQELSWLEQSFNLIFLGPPGVGKTHIAVGLGLEAIQKGQRVSFVSMGELIPLLKTEEYLRKSQLKMKRVREANLVIIDDLMYMAMDQNEANLFFHLINHLYERSSIILTSNKGPEEWGELLGDQGITTAILDRLLHRSEVINFDGPSHRIKYRESLFQAKSVQS